MKKLTKRQRIINAINKHGALSVGKLRDYVKDANYKEVAKIRDEVLQNEGKPKTKNTGIKSISPVELRARHNPHYKISKALKTIPKGCIYEEQDFKRYMSTEGVNPTQYNREVRDSEFDKYKGKSLTGNIYYIGDPKEIKAAKEDGTLI